jgi:IS30 family transposase
MTAKLPQEEVLDLEQKNRGHKLNKNHLTLEERKIIQAGIGNGSTKAAIIRTTGKDATTVAKEIIKHREFKRRNSYARPVMYAS